LISHSFGSVRERQFESGLSLNKRRSDIQKLRRSASREFTSASGLATIIQNKKLFTEDMSQQSHNSSPSFHGVAIEKEERLVLLYGAGNGRLSTEKWNNPQQAA